MLLFMPGALAQGLPQGRRECSALCTCGCNDTADRGCPCAGRAAPSQAPPADVPNYGIDLDRLARPDDSCRYRLGGREVSREEARQAVEAPQLPDDAGKLRITVIGPDADRRCVLDEIAQTRALDPWRERFVIRDYPPDHWAVARAGFVTTGRPTVYVQAPDGQVLHRQDDYQPGDVLKVCLALRQMQAVRQPRPYDPGRDPDLRKPQPAPGPEPGPTPPAPALPGWLLWSAAGLALLVLLLPRRTQ